MSGGENKTKVHIKLRGNLRIDQIDEFVYLERNDGRNKSSIIKRICQAKIVFNSKKTLLTLKNISLKVRENLLKTYMEV